MNWKPRFLPPSVITVTQRMAAEDAEKLMNTTRQPSADALRLAVLLSGHEGTQCKYGARVCEGCIADARIIDRELKLPQRNAALLLAQAICDGRDRREDILGLVDLLREALKVL